MFFNLFSIEFVANHALLVALNLSRITHFWCKFLGPQKAAGVKILVENAITGGLKNYFVTNHAILV